MRRIGAWRVQAQSRWTRFQKGRRVYPQQMQSMRLLLITEAVIKKISLQMFARPA